MGIRLLETGFQVKFLSFENIAKDMITELNVVGKQQDTHVGRDESFSVTKHDLFDCEVLGKFANNFHL